MVLNHLCNIFSERIRVVKDGLGRSTIFAEGDVHSETLLWTILLYFYLYV